MSLIVHRCQKCQHVEHDHSPKFCKLGSCRCNVEAFDAGPAEVIPTFNDSGEVVERIVPPGDGLRSQTGHVIVKACDCTECAQLAEASA